MTPAFFGPPVGVPKRGGARIIVLVLPLHEGRLAVFTLQGRDAPPGRWLPWAPIPYGEHPHAAASSVVDAWCDAGMVCLELIEVDSRIEDGIWELALVFRADLAEPPRGDAVHRPEMVPPAAAGDIAGVEPEALLRYLASGPEPAPPPGLRVF